MAILSRNTHDRNLSRNPATKPNSALPARWASHGGDCSTPPGPSAERYTQPVPTPPVESPYCVHCGYDKAGLSAGAQDCPECGHSLDDSYIPAMAIPPRWWRVHRLGWRLSEASSYAMLATAACLIAGFVSLIVYDIRSGGNTPGLGAMTILIRNIGFGFASLALVLTFAGGVCAFARVPWNEEREQNRGLLLATISLAVPLLGAIPLALLLTWVPVPFVVFAAMIMASAALVLIDVRMLKGRAASFIRFTTNDTQSAFYDDSHRSVDIAAVIAIIGGLYMALGGARPNLAVLAYALMLFGWLGMRGRAAAVIRREVTRSIRACSDANQ